MFAGFIESRNYCVFTMNRITLCDETNFPTIEILFKKFISKDMKTLECLLRIRIECF